jgi:hypothetical protein
MSKPSGQPSQTTAPIFRVWGWATEAGEPQAAIKGSNSIETMSKPWIDNFIFLSFFDRQFLDTRTARLYASMSIARFLLSFDSNFQVAAQAVGLRFRYEQRESDKLLRQELENSQQQKSRI